MSERRFVHISAKGQMTEIPRLEDALAARSRGGYVWLDFASPTRAELEVLIEPLGLHPLAIEDCLDDDQVPKLEDFAGNSFILFNRYHYRDQKVSVEEIDFFLGPNFLVSVAAHASESAAHKKLDETLRIQQSSIGHGPDYLLHVILDQIVDDKLVAIEALQDELDRIEEAGLKHVSAFRPAKILHLRRDLLALRKSLFHEREILLKICRKDSPYISDKAIYHFRDIYDHLVKFVELVEVCREMIATLMEIYLSLVNNELARLGNRTNQVVRRLTFVTTVFMPLSFLAGVFGMSEWSMMTGPENWRIAYPAFLAAMAVTGVATHVWLRRWDIRSRSHQE